MRGATVLRLKRGTVVQAYSGVRRHEARDSERPAWWHTRLHGFGVGNISNPARLNLKSAGTGTYRTVPVSPTSSWVQGSFHCPWTAPRSESDSCSARGNGAGRDDWRVRARGGDGWATVLTGARGLQSGRSRRRGTPERAYQHFHPLRLRPPGPRGRAERGRRGCGESPRCGSDSSRCAPVPARDTRPRAGRCQQCGVGQPVAGFRRHFCQGQVRHVKGFATGPGSRRRGGRRGVDGPKCNRSRAMFARFSLYRKMKDIA